MCIKKHPCTVLKQVNLYEKLSSQVQQTITKMPPKRKKVDARVRTLIENGVKKNHRSFFVVVGDRGREQIPNLHYVLLGLPFSLNFFLLLFSSSSSSSLKACSWRKTATCCVTSFAVDDKASKWEDNTECNVFSKSSAVNLLRSDMGEALKQVLGNIDTIQHCYPDIHHSKDHAIWFHSSTNRYSNCIDLVFINQHCPNHCCFFLPTNEFTKCLIFTFAAHQIQSKQQQQQRFTHSLQC